MVYTQCATATTATLEEKIGKLFGLLLISWNGTIERNERRKGGEGRERDWENVVRNLKTVCFFHHFERRLSHLINLRTFRERAKQKYFLNYFQFNRSANFLRRTQRQIIISRQRNAPTHNPHFEIILNTIWRMENRNTTPTANHNKYFSSQPFATTKILTF